MPRTTDPPGSTVLRQTSRGFSVNEAAQITSVPSTSMNFWSGRANVLTPEVAYAGRGSRRLFSERNLVQIRLTHLLTQRWIPLKTIRALMRRQADWFNPRAHVWGPAEILVFRGNVDWQLRSSGLSQGGQPSEGSAAGPYGPRGRAGRQSGQGKALHPEEALSGCLKFLPSGSSRRSVASGVVASEGSAHHPRLRSRASCGSSRTPPYM